MTNSRSRFSNKDFKFKGQDDMWLEKECYPENEVDWGAMAKGV